MKPYSDQEEKWNIITHGIGVLLSIIGMAFMLRHALGKGEPMVIICTVIYSLSLIVLYAASTIYHIAWEKVWKDALRKVDKLCIYLLIAGTYTPVLLLGIGGRWGWTLFSLVWAMAALGFVFQFSTWHRSEKLSLALYAGMGWLAIIAVKPILNQLEPEAIALLLTGGLLYTGGIYFYAKEKIHFNHVIWHLFVLGGSITHFFGIYFYVL